MSDYVRKSLGLNNIKTAVIGATIIDTDNAIGLNVSGNTMSIPRHEDKNIACPNDALSFYPSVENNERENSEAVLALGAVWFNGFIPYCRGLADPENCTHTTANIMAGYGVVTTDQVIKSRPDEWVNCIFSAFKWFNGTEDDRIASSDLQIDTAIGKVIRKGLIHPNWLHNPVSIRYMVRELASNNSERDYAYFIGGSEYLLGDDPREMCNIIGQKIKTANNLMEASQDIPKDISNNSEINNVRKVWHQVDISKYSDDFKNHSYVKARLLCREVNRAIQGIIMIRNYFVYARKYLGVETVIDMDMKRSSDPLKVSIESVIDRYNDAYKFIRNLCNCEVDIGEGKIVG